MQLSKKTFFYFIGLVCLFVQPIQANNKAISTTNEVDNGMFELLLKRIEILERRNDETEKKMGEMADAFETKERLLTNRIAELEKLNNLRNCDDQAHANVPEKQHDMLQDYEKTKGIDGEREPKQNRINSLGSIQRRATDGSKAAFFATVTSHDVDHLGQNQNIVFDNAVTNIGNAYHDTHGIFTAPVDGTYVFCATVTGRHYTETADENYYAHLDVNGRNLAKLITHFNEQSTQTIVVQLQAGDDVSIKNDQPDDRLLGDKYTSFTGFLLYENFDSSTSILGK